MPRFKLAFGFFDMDSGKPVNFVDGGILEERKQIIFEWTKEEERRAGINAPEFVDDIIRASCLSLYKFLSDQLGISDRKKAAIMASAAAVSLEAENLLRANVKITPLVEEALAALRSGAVWPAIAPPE